MHALGQLRVKVRMPWQHMGDMGDIGLLGAHPFEEGEGFGQGEMRKVGRALDAVDGYGLDSAQFLKSFLLDIVHIRQIGHVPESEAEHGEHLLLVVPALKGHDFKGRDTFHRVRWFAVVALAGFPDEVGLGLVGVHEEVAAAVNAVDLPFRAAGIAGLGEGVAVLLAHRIFYIFFAIYVHRLAFEQVEGTHFVKASGVVLVVVGEQYCVQMLYARAQHLLPEIRAAVNAEGYAAALYEYAGAEAFVPRVRAAAYGAVATYDRHALGGACSQEGEFCFHPTVRFLLSVLRGLGRTAL